MADVPARDPALSHGFFDHVLIGLRQSLSPYGEWWDKVLHDWPWSGVFVPEDIQEKIRDELRSLFQLEDGPMRRAPSVPAMVTLLQAVQIVEASGWMERRHAIVLTDDGWFMAVWYGCWCGATDDDYLVITARDRGMLDYQGRCWHRTAAGEKFMITGSGTVPVKGFESTLNAYCWHVVGDQHTAGGIGAVLTG